MYPEHNQLDPDNPNCEESSAYQQIQIQNMDGETFSERLYLTIKV